MNKHGVRSKFDRLRVPANLPSPTAEAVTQQQFVAECDMNRIVLNAMRGVPSRFARDPASAKYGDFSGVPDMTQALNKINTAKEAFMTLPARLRLELDNDFRNIDKLTAEQIEHYKLGKAPPEAAEPIVLPSETPPAKAKPKPPKAGQAASAGTEPAHSRSVSDEDTD